MNTPLISIVIPVYNVKKYLRQCVDSVLNQTYNNLQVILVDDGSTDGSSDICDEYKQKDNRVKVIHQKNMGNSGARNRGIAAVEGEYVGFVDSDDWIHPRMYEHLLNIILKYEADISTIEPVEFIDKVYMKQLNNEETCVMSQREYAKIFFKIGTQKIVYYVWSKLYKREIVQNNCFERAYSIGEDVITSYKFLLSAKKIVVSNQALYYYRQNSGMTSHFNEKYLLLEDVWNRVADITKDNNLTEYQEYVKINQIRINFTILTEIAIAGEYKNPLYLKRIEHYVKELKKGKKVLLQSGISFNRKILIEFCCHNYGLYAMTIYGFRKLLKR